MNSRRRQRRLLSSCSRCSLLLTVAALCWSHSKAWGGVTIFPASLARRCGLLAWLFPRPLRGRSLLPIQSSIQTNREHHWKEAPPHSFLATFLVCSLICLFLFFPIQVFPAPLIVSQLPHLGILRTSPTNRLPLPLLFRSFIPLRPPTTTLTTETKHVQLCDPHPPPLTLLISPPILSRGPASPPRCRAWMARHFSAPAAALH